LASLRSGFELPIVNLRVAIDVSRVQNDKQRSPAPSIGATAATGAQPSANAVEHSIIERHVDAFIRRCPELAQFRHSAISASCNDANVFLEFCNDAVCLFGEASHEVQLRRLLARLRKEVSSPGFQDLIGQRIAESDLRSGVVDRALRLKDEPAFAEQIAVEICEYDRHYGAPEGYLSKAFGGLTFEGDVRGRTLALFYGKHIEIVRGRRILHVAPEPLLREFFEQRRAALACIYETLDGFSEETNYRSDLTRITLPDESYDVVICHRVLEHVMDDVAAMTELHRILAPGGLLNVSVPQSMNRPETNEWRANDTSHHMHVRQYGRDFEQRLRTVGFDVDVDRSVLEMPLVEHRELGTYPMRHYLCRKQSGS
jgi:SAM-dependent methyltransferase